MTSRQASSLAAIALSVALLGASPRRSWAQNAQQRTAPPPFTIRRNVTLVDVPVLALDRSGSPIRGLTKANFRVLDDGEPVRLAGFDGHERPLSLALVIDASDYSAVQQARRSALVITRMVMGSSGKMSIFVAGPEPRQLTPFTNNRSELENILRHLKLQSRGPDITQPLQMAILKLEKQPDSRTRAALVISRQNTKHGSFNEAIVETTMSDAIPVFKLYPNAPKTREAPNPLSPEQSGTGVGSNRVQHPASPIGHNGGPEPTPGTVGNVDLSSILGGIKNSLPSRQINYITETGGMALKAGNDRQFDQRLSEIGEALRGMYHLYYTPPGLSPTPTVHMVQVRIASSQPIAKSSYRHTYVSYLRR